MLTRLTLLLVLIVHASAYSQDPGSDSLQLIHYGEAPEDSYSLLLPPGYDSTKKYPILIFLDPAGRGDVPVRRNAVIAQQQNVILAGSYGSRNFDPTSSARSIAGIYDDVNRKLKIDLSKVWLAGFSGGARMANSFAETFSEIRGVIACGAGFAEPSSKDKLLGYPFAGIVGTSDMNYEEMVGIHEDLSKFRNENLLLFFNGGHEWPPASVIATAVCWLNKETCPAEQVELIRTTIRNTVNERENGMLYSKWLWVNEFRKITATFLSADSMSRFIENKKSFKKDKAQFAAMLQEERNYMDEFTIGFNKAILMAEAPIDEAAWSQRFKSVMVGMRSGENYDSFSAIRRLDFSRRLCMEQFQFFMQNKKYREAYTCASILKNFDTGFPLSAEIFLARAAAGLGDGALTRKHLLTGLRSQRLQKQNILRDPLLLQLMGKEKLEEMIKE